MIRTDGEDLNLGGACALDSIIDSLLMAIRDEFISLDGCKDERVAKCVLDQFLDPG